MTGVEFGQRSTKTVCARIYDKTLQIEQKGLDWWPMIWGERFDRSKQVLRVEFEVGRQGLKEFGIDSPQDGLEMAPEMWASVTESWLSYRSPSTDQTRSRWPVAPEWVSVQHASLRGGVVGIDRVRAARRKGELQRLVPALVGYMAGVGALCGAPDLASTLGAVRHLAEQDERQRGVMFADRIAERAAEEARR
ncbi:MAG: hypothetical protein V9E99_02865 [Microthrixaceae bacterium]